MNGQNRDDIYSGLGVDIILKKDQGSGTLTRGQVQDILTSSSFHSRGIKVRLTSGEVGRVAHIVEQEKQVIVEGGESKNMPHYICTGGCEGVSDTPGVCQADDCRKHQHSLQECSCADDKHTEVMAADESAA
ncbi:YwbE family protein [Patescibacteria group bacterium]|nr:YwbE family protein [Patescibacteria group bacterium]